MQTVTIEPARPGRPSYRLHVVDPMPAVADAPVVFALDKLEVFYGSFRAVRDVSRALGFIEPPAPEKGRKPVAEAELET